MSLYQYIEAHDQYFWKWEDNYSVVEIPGGNTIAYTELIKEILIQLKDQGLPPFGSLLLAMVGLGSAVDSALKQIETVLAAKLTEFHPNSGNNQVLFAEACRFL